MDRILKKLTGKTLQGTVKKTFKSKHLNNMKVNF